MIDWRYINKVSQLIERKIRAQLTDEEERWLEEWRNSSPDNEDLYQRLLDEDTLKVEYQRRELMSTEKALTAMKRRILLYKWEHKRKAAIRWTVPTIASAAAIWIFFFFLFPFNKHASDSLVALDQTTKSDSIIAGSTKAMLTLADGSSINLSQNLENKVKESKTVVQEPETKISPKDNILTIPRGGEFKVILEDGTEVWLNAESQLCYPESFTGNERRVKLVKGEAFFKVTKNEQKPFYVETRGQVVRVYGTEFNINSYDEDTFVYTTLVSGKISLQRNNQSNAEVVLTPGHQALFDTQNTSLKVKTVNTTVVSSWREGRFVFEEQNLEQIMQTLSRWYNFSYEFKTEDLKRVEFMGTVSRYSKFDDIVEMLEKSGNNLTILTKGDHVIIMRR